MQEWETYKRAALEYSRMRPRRVLAQITLVTDTKVQTAPAGCLDIQSLAWGDRAEVGEVYLDDVGTTQAWAFEPGTLLVTPAPTAEDTLTVNIIYLAQHIGNEETQEFTTIPAEHLHFVDDLEQAVVLDLEADDASRGASTYSVGQTQVDRSKAVADLRTRAKVLRDRVRQAVEDPLSLWS